MADKTWTAVDVKLGTLSFYPRGASIGVQRQYEFVDADGNVLEQIAGGAVVEEFVFADLPANIQQALSDINNWTHQKALEQEGMA